MNSRYTPEARNKTPKHQYNSVISKDTPYDKPRLQSRGQRAMSPPQHISSMLITPKSKREREFEETIQGVSKISVFDESHSNIDFEQLEKKNSSTKEVNVDRRKKNKSKKESELVNIKVDSHKKVSKESLPQVEIWDDQMKPDKVLYSDVPDEFEYEFDPTYLSTKRATFTQEVSSRNPEIKSAKERHFGTDTKKNNSQQKTEKRVIVREKEVKQKDGKSNSEVEIRKKSKTTMNSPERSVQAHFESKTEADFSQEEPKKKKMGMQQTQKMYERMMLYEQRKWKAIQMIKDAQQKEKEYEFNELSVHQRRTLSPEIAERAAIRLNKDSEIREQKKKKYQEELMLREQELLKTYFTPKINKGVQKKKAPGAFKPGEGQLNRMEQFVQDAQQRNKKQ